MEHERAIRDRIAERYLLGDLPAAERDAFEAHFFDCPSCAEDVRSGLIFRANARAVFREGGFEDALPDESAAREIGERAALPPSRESRDGAGARHSFWSGPFQWVWASPRLAFSFALNLVLLAAAGSQVWHTAGLNRALEEFRRPAFAVSAFVPAASRGEVRQIEVPRGTRTLELLFDLQAEELNYPEYTCTLEGAGGLKLRSGALGVPVSRRNEVRLALPLTGLEPGSYLVVFGGARTGKSTELRRANLHIPE